MKPKVLLIGDSCIDEYKIGTVDRLSPEAPVPVIKIVETQTVPGMAANVNLNLKNLGIDTCFIHNAEGIVKTRYVDKRSGQHMIRVDVEPEVTPWDGDFVEPIESFDAVVISDYDKGFLSYEAIEKIIQSTDAPVFIDTKKTDLLRFDIINVFVKINEVESSRARGNTYNTIVTMGGEGARYRGKIFPTKKVEVMDVCGCGDTFLASLCARYLLTENIEDAIIFANEVAGITVQHRGNYAPTYEEIRTA